MRDYGKVSPQFWIGDTGKALRAHGCKAQLLALYLVTNPHANMIGLYYLPKMFIAHELGWPIEGASEALQRCIEAQFCSYDEASEVVFVHEMARFQIAEQLKPDDKRCKGVENELGELPETTLQQAFRHKYAKAFCIAKAGGASKGLRRGLEDPPKPRAGTRARTGAGTRDILPEGFDEFWQVYPKREARKDAIKAWENLNPDEALRAVMVAAVKVHAATERWRKDGGQFIPNPATWLNKRRWEDEVKPVLAGADDGLFRRAS